MKVEKREKAITLVALVVTIIILLILAGVTISLVVGQGGLIQRAKNSGNIYKKAELNESKELDEYGQAVESEMQELENKNLSFENTDRTIDDLNKDSGDSNNDGIVDTNDDLRGFYADLNNDGELTEADDGVIFGDLKTGGKGVFWGDSTEGMYDDIDSMLDDEITKGWMQESERAAIKERYVNADKRTKESLGFRYRIKSDCIRASSYTIPTKTNLNDYEFIRDTDGSIKQFSGPFGTHGMLQQKNKLTNGNRFYVMALADFIDTNGNSMFTWYKNAVDENSRRASIKNQYTMTKTLNFDSNIFNNDKKGQYQIIPISVMNEATYGYMTDYDKYTSTEFTKGEENTTKMIARANNNGKDPYDSSNTSNYGVLSDKDIWKVVQPSASKGWFLSSRDEWNAFGAFFKICYLNGIGYSNERELYKLESYYWSSSQLDTARIWMVNFDWGGSISHFDAALVNSVRLAITF